MKQKVRPKISHLRQMSWTPPPTFFIYCNSQENTKHASVGKAKQFLAHTPSCRQGLKMTSWKSHRPRTVAGQSLGVGVCTSEKHCSWWCYHQPSKIKIPWSSYGELITFLPHCTPQICKASAHYTPCVPWSSGRKWHHCARKREVFLLLLANTTMLHLGSIPQGGRSHSVEDTKHTSWNPLS